VVASPTNLTNYMNCLSLFESKTAKLYLDLAEKVELPLVKSLLMEISLDSQKHSNLLTGISKSMPKSDFNPKTCAEKVGESWQIAETYAKKVAKKEKITAKDLPELIHDLDALESSMGEEYSLLIQMNTLVVLAGEIENSYSISLDGVKSIFSGILEDEEHHKEVLALIREIIKKKELELIAEDPLFEYRRIGVPTQ
jgi:hypothetical protein